MQVNTACSFLGPLQIQALEQNYKAKYVLESAIKDSKDNWANQPVAIFYTEKAHPDGSNYFGVFFRDGMPYITDGISAVQGTFQGVYDTRDEVIEYSRYRHDYRDCGQFFVDGGRDYLHWGALNPDVCKTATFRVINGEVIIDG
jgi:hypothetical protein